MPDLGSSTTRPPIDLPAGYRWAGSDEGWLALWDERALELQRAGYSAASDAPLLPSKHAGRGNLAEIDLAGGRLLVRRFQHGGLLRGVTGERYLSPKRPFLELQLSEQLRAAGFRTPRVVAARARRSGPLAWHLELITERVPGTRDLGYMLAEARTGTLSGELRRRLCQGAGELVRDLHGAGFLHADLQPANVLWEEGDDSPETGSVESDQPAQSGEPADFALSPEGETHAAASRPPRLWVLDLDGSVWRYPLGRPERIANLRRLWRNVERRERSLGPSLTGADLARFLRAYDPADWRSLATEIEASRARREPLHRVGHALDGGRRIAKDPRS